jgi:hypothetical protein
VVGTDVVELLYVDVRIERRHRHPEGDAAARDLTTDGAETDDPQTCTRDLLTDQP